MKVNVTQAASLTGKARTTLYKDMDKGVISFEKDATGKKLLDVSELERVYGLKKQTGNDNQPESGDPVSEAAVLRERVRHLEKDQITSRETIEDLRRRLDEEASERKRLNLLLTDQRENKNGQGDMEKEVLAKAIADLTRQQAEIVKQLEGGRPTFWRWLGFRRASG